MPERTPAPPDRLDSWKAIADYLQRDVATVRRWEKLSGLPIRRVPGGRGRSVFAYVSEIDAWLKATPPAEVPANGRSLPATPAPARPMWRSGVAAAAALIVLAGLVWRSRDPIASETPSSVNVTPEGIVALGSSGEERWHYRFAPEDRSVPPAPFAEPQILGGPNPGVLAATANRHRPADGLIRSGQLLWLTPDGTLARSFSFDDRLAFRTVTYSAPWMITDFRVDERGGRRRIAVAAHHHHWWPSLVTVLDDRWRRQGTFVHAGWVEQVRWLSPDLLLISGFSNGRDGGMLGIVDARALDGQSPVEEESEFRCTACGVGSLLRYVILPRSEVNLVSASPFNRAFVQIQGGRLLVRTVEVPRIAQAVEAFYEFSSSLDLVRASFGDRYWEMHRALEAEGKIAHTRDECPDRAGPRAIEVWEPVSGWRTVRLEMSRPEHRAR